MIDVNLLYPIGSIYMSIQSTNPSTFFGGTWERIAKGKTLVGVDENDTDFNVSSKTGGEKTHKLTIDEMPSHNHSVNSRATTFADTGSYNPQQGSGDRTWKNLTVNNTGGGQSHNNLQPFYTCYIFVRTA